VAFVGAPEHELDVLDERLDVTGRRDDLAEVAPAGGGNDHERYPETDERH
jgi:hypothetical protein